MIQVFNRPFLLNHPGLVEVDEEVIDLKFPLLGIEPGRYLIIGKAGPFIWGERI